MKEKDVAFESSNHIFNSIKHYFTQCKRNTIQRYVIKFGTAFSPKQSMFVLALQAFKQRK